jgi:predicted nuclease of predicted toxin-antitoxin system
MKLCLDHCVSKRTVDYLRQSGHDTLTAKELGKERAIDPDILALAGSTDRVMVTEDRGPSGTASPSGYAGVDSS